MVGIGLAALADHIQVLEPLQRLHLTPDLILYIIIPTLVFDAAVSIDSRLLLKNLSPVLMLAAPGLLISTLIVGGLVAVLTVCAAACGSDGDSDSADGGGDGDAPPTSISSTTTSAAGASLVLDGEECTYEGPTELSEGPLVVGVENQSDSDASFAVHRLGNPDDRLLFFSRRIEELQATIEREGEASAEPLEAWDETHRQETGFTATSVDIPPGETGELTAVTPVGYYALVCKNFEGGIPFAVDSPVTFVGLARPAQVRVTG